jgi:hypothetical protein
MDYLNITSSEDYLRLVTQYSFLVDHELSLFEVSISEGTRPLDIADRIPKLISLVNVIGYLRGQDGAFSNMHEYRKEAKADLYQNEDDFEKRLSSIIEYITSDTEAMKWCRAKLMEYYLLHRGMTFGSNTRIE